MSATATAMRAGFVSLLLWVVPFLPFAEAHAATTTVRIGHFPNLTHAQAIYARATGEFEKIVGVPISWVSFNAGPSAIEAIFTDAVDLSYIGPSPSINGYIKSKGEKFVVVAGAAMGGAGLVIRSDSGIKSEKDFDGKTIATPQLGNTQDVAARTWFAGQGYKLKEKGGTLGLVPLSNPDQLTMFRKRQVDGAWTVEPWLSRLELEGKGELFLDEGTLWPEGRYITTQLIVSRSFLRSQPELLRKLLLAHVEVTRRVQADPGRAGAILNAELKKETGKALSAEVVSRAMGRVKFTWDPVPSSLYRSAESSHRIGFIRKAPNLKGIYELGPLNSVLKELNLPPVTE